MNYFFDFGWLVEVVFPAIGELFGYFIAFGEVDTVVLDYLLRGNTFSWEVLNIFTGENTIVTVYSYGEFFDILEGLFANGLPDILSSLLNLFEGVFSFIGHAFYLLLFGTPFNMPLWVSIIIVYPRALLLTLIFKFFKNFISEVFIS